MASTNKTENIGLNLWTADDIPKRADFVSDNEKIDAALMNIKESGMKFSLQSYTGNGKKSKIIMCDTEPKFLFVACKTHNETEFDGENVQVYGGTVLPGDLCQGGVLSGKRITLKSEGIYHFNDDGVEYSIGIIT